MRLFFVFILLALGNVFAYGFLTRPAVGELEWLEARCRELDEVLAVEEATAAKWYQLVEVVEIAQSVLEPLSSRGGSTQSSLRRAFLEAERGLRLRRDALEFRPERAVPNGFDGVRIRVAEAGRYADLVTYLHRISRLKVPLTPVEMYLVESSREEAPLSLTMTWSALWPKESGS
jgi:hypothetical protein